VASSQWLRLLDALLQSVEGALDDLFLAAAP
jgi:hypothetical protein